jgi:hypothetical protein
MAIVDILLELEAVFAPSSARLLTGQANSLYHDFAAA